MPLRQALKIALDALWGLITIVIILGGILSGVFTAIESARSPASTRSSSPCSSTGTTSGATCRSCVHRVTKTVAMVMMVIGFAAGFGYLMAMMQMPAKATTFFITVTDNKYVMLMLINVLLLLLGTFMDMAPMILICTPILLPVVKALGVDPVHFGMIMLLNLGIGLITPPVGPTLFVGCAIGKVTMEEVSAMAVLRRHVLALLIVTYVPALALAAAAARAVGEGSGSAVTAIGQKLPSATGSSRYYTGSCVGQAASVPLAGRAFAFMLSTSATCSGLPGLRKDVDEYC